MADERPVLTERGGWTYKGWSFHDANRDGWFKIHGPNSKGKRARKIVHGYSAAVAYIDKRT